LWLVVADAVVEDLLQLLTTARGPNACRHVRYCAASEASADVTRTAGGSAAIILALNLSDAQSVALVKLINKFLTIFGKV
jgi:hypothetical protein